MRRQPVDDLFMLGIMLGFFLLMRLFLEACAYLTWSR
jgi:hypothetical protein